MMWVRVAKKSVEEKIGIMKKKKKLKDRKE